MDREMDRREHLLKMSLEVAVPIQTMELLDRGGPTERDLAHVKSYQEDLAAHGDDLLFRSSKAGQTAARFTQVAEIIAVLSFCPGGITVFGLHFDGNEMREKWNDSARYAGDGKASEEDTTVTGLSITRPQPRLRDHRHQSSSLPTPIQLDLFLPSAEDE